MSTTFTVRQIVNGYIVTESLGLGGLVGHNPAETYCADVEAILVHVKAMLGPEKRRAA